jgi:hypothetical protein
LPERAAFYHDSRSTFAAAKKPGDEPGFCFIRSATTCFLSNSAPSGHRDNFAAFGVEVMLDRFTRVFIILNEQDAGLLFLHRTSDSSTPREQT